MATRQKVLVVVADELALGAVDGRDGCRLRQLVEDVGKELLDLLVSGREQLRLFDFTRP